MNITIAGAGAGKTTNLASRIKQRYLKSNDSRNIYCIAYTNNAVDNISRRLAEVFQGSTPDYIHVQTIHSFLFQEIIRPYYYLLFGNSFDKFSYKDKGKDARYYQKLYRELEEKRILHVDATTQRASWVMVKRTDDNAVIKKRRKIVQNNFAECCNSIFIDEAQDIDKETYKILKVFDAIGIWIDLVGDPKQDLRGHGYLRLLMKEYSNCVSYVTECHRCPDKILKLSNSIVSDSEKQHSGIAGGEIKILFESHQENVADIIKSPLYDLKYIHKKNALFDTHVISEAPLQDSLTEIFNEILPMYFPNIVSSELRRKRAAYYVARKFIDDYIGGVTLAKSIISIFGKQISKKEYVRIASTLQACEQKANTGASFVVDSIEKIKGREGKNCLFILTPDLAAYLFGDKTDYNKTKCALYVGLTRSLDSITIFVTKETEQKYSSKQFEELFLNL